MQSYISMLFLICTILFSQNSMAESLRVDSQWLKSNLEKNNLIILDTRSFEDYELGHIPGAINFPDNLSYEEKGVGGKIVGPQAIQKTFREKGIDTESFIVVYDDGGVFDAARVFWMLEVYGIKQVRILNGGFVNWLRGGNDETQKIERIDASHYVARVDHRRIASKFITRIASLNPNSTIIDARATKAYAGEISSAKRFGHIPSAKNIAVHENLVGNIDTGKQLRPIQALASLYKNIPKDKKVILYCDAGKVSSTNYLALRELGYDVANYDASWKEWGNDLSLPIEK